MWESLCDAPMDFSTSLQVLHQLVDTYKRTDYDMQAALACFAREIEA